MKKDINFTLTPFRTWGVSLAVLFMLIGVPLYLSTDAKHANTVYNVIGEKTALKANIEPTGTPRVKDKSLVYMGTVVKRDAAPFMSLDKSLTLLLTVFYLIGLASLTLFAVRCEPSTKQAFMAIAPGALTLGVCLVTSSFVYVAFIALTLAVTAAALGATTVQYIRSTSKEPGDTATDDSTATTRMAAVPPQAVPA